MHCKRADKEGIINAVIPKEARHSAGMLARRGTVDAIVPYEARSSTSVSDKAMQ